MSAQNARPIYLSQRSTTAAASIPLGPFGMFFAAQAQKSPGGVDLQQN
jgi:hypothetical protein